MIWHRAVRRDTTVGGGDITQFRAEYTPTSHDGLFGIFQLYVRGVALGDASTTALYPHAQDVRYLCALAERRGLHLRQHLPLGDTFDHLKLSVRTTRQDVVFNFTTYPERQLPAWAPRPGNPKRLIVRRAEVINAWRAAEPQFRRFLEFL